MSAVVAYEDLYGRNGEKLTVMVEDRLDEVAALEAWRESQDADAIPHAVARLIPGIRDLGFMTLLSVRENIHLPPALIERLRALYLDIDASILESPVMGLLSEDVGESLRSVCMELASSICIADVTNSEKIISIMARVKANG